MWFTLVRTVLTVHLGGLALASTSGLDIPSVLSRRLWRLCCSVLDRVSCTWRSYLTIFEDGMDGMDSLWNGQDKLIGR